MLRTLSTAAQVLLLILVGYDLVVALFGWAAPRRSLPSARTRRFRVVIPAHDESGVIGGVLGDLASVDYPAGRVTVVVVADRCTDDTAAAARSFGVEVAERGAGAEGKGAALAWYLAGRPLAEEEALVVLDADNRVPPDLLSRFADELAGDRTVLQAYLDVTNPDASWLTTASALSYWAGNRMVQLARSRLGWSPDLGGTGMCFLPSALDAAGGLGDSLVEDREAAIRLALAGVAVSWLHDVRIRDEKPAGAGAAVRQRARWVRGKRQVVRRYLGRLLAEAGRRRSAALLDQAIRLVHPGRSFVALGSAVITALAAITGSDLLLPWEVWAAATVLQFAAPLIFLARDGVRARYLVRYPALVLLAVLWVPIRLLSRLTGDRWYHTPHGEGAGGGN